MKFEEIFQGLNEAYGCFKIESKNGFKAKGKAGVIREPRTEAVWQNHLDGNGVGLGIIPINADNACKWGCMSRGVNLKTKCR